MPELVTVASFPSPAQAACVRNVLEAAGVQAFLADESMVATAWYLSNALAGVKVQVAAEDGVKAKEILAEAADEEGFPAGGLLEEDEIDAGTPREQDAQRALKAAVFGLLFCPLQLYAFWLLLRVFASDQRLAGRPRRYAIIAAAINLPIIVLLLVFARGLFVS